MNDGTSMPNCQTKGSYSTTSLKNLYDYWSHQWNILRQRRFSQCNPTANDAAVLPRDKVPSLALSVSVVYQKEHPAYKKWLTRCWLGYLSETMCKWIAYSPADSTVTPSFLALLKSETIYLSGAGLPRPSWKKAIKRVLFQLKQFNLCPFMFITLRC